MNKGSDHAIVATATRGVATATDMTPANANAKEDVRCLKNSKPDSHTMHPKRIAFSTCTDDKGSIPRRKSIPPSNRGNSGGQLVTGVPEWLTKPLPAETLRATSTYLTESGDRPAPYLLVASKIMPTPIRLKMESATLSLQVICFSLYLVSLPLFSGMCVI